jgi:hypothetical protein
MEKFLVAFRPGRFEFGCGDVPVGPAFLENDAQVLAEFFDSGPAEEPVAHVDFVDDRLCGRGGLIGLSYSIRRLCSIE